MDIRKFVWLDTKADKTLIAEVRAVGVRTVARGVGCSAALVSRWISGRNGMAFDKFTKVSKLLTGAGP